MSEIRVVPPPEILDERRAGFFLLDDGTPAPDPSTIVKYLENQGYTVCTLSLQGVAVLLSNRLISMLASLDISTLVSLGDGGAQFLAALSSASCDLPDHLEILRIRWSRTWRDDVEGEFEHDLDRFSWDGRRVLLVEDVVASGRTLEGAQSALFERGANVAAVATAVALGTSPWLRMAPVPLLVGLVAHGVDRVPFEHGRSTDDPHWFPPFYSSRHLFFGDRDMPRFYERLAALYFGGDDTIQQLVLTLRGE